MTKNLKYSIGLDIGTSSVGWCVTDEENNIVKKSGKHLWGSRLFDEGKTAADTRTFRGVRRRTERRKNRIRYLQSMLLEDIEKVDENFIPRLQQSNLIKDDKNQFKFNLFEDEDFIDKEYYSEYPTIYHLRNALVTKDQKFDIRLVYLALHHIIKYRGNFLTKGEISDDISNIESDFEEIIEYLKSNEIYLTASIKEITDILKNKEYTKSEKEKTITSLFDYEKEDKPIIQNICKSIAGLKFDLNAVFNIEGDKRSLEFSSDNDWDNIANELNENAEVFYSMKNIYSWTIIQSFLQGNDYISESFINKYEKYNADLKVLKSVYKKYLDERQYNKMFKIYESDNYCSYNGKTSNIKDSKKCSIEDLYKKIKKDFKGFEEEIEIQNILVDMVNENFLVKLNTTTNGEIPYQLHEKELKNILENQSKYHESIKENKDKILSLLTFRIPYYVGPLSKNSKWAWLKTKGEESIRPWNFDEIVDKDATAEEFIRRMTNKCTYLLNEDVIPKESLLYAEYSVLNEINTIQVNEEKISKDMKFKILELFKTKKSVGKKDIKNLYAKDGINADKIEGFTTKECKFNSNMKSYIDFSKIIENVEENRKMIEELIYWITIFEDKSILKRKIEQKYSEILNKEQIDKIVRLNYTGWSRLSERLLIGLKSKENNETIMDKLINTNMNFMQIITSGKFGFKELLEEEMQNAIGNKKGKITYDDIAELKTSPANKKGIWQAILVVKEITKILKAEPENIYIEFARSDEEKGITNKKKLDKIEQQYKEIKDFAKNNKELLIELSQSKNQDKNISERLCLYFMQMGKCMYSNERLDIEKLSSYQIDHIIPQSYIKDDSIDNKVLVLPEENQRKKDSLLLSDEIIERMTPTWTYLNEKGLISELKYKRLIKRKMFSNEEEEIKFISRQIVETRQITKYVREILTNLYPNTEIVGLKASITSNFREKYRLYKIRNLNDCHHAQDAYIMCVTGKAFKESKLLKYEKIKHFLEEEKRKSAEEKNLDQKEKYGIIMKIIRKRVDIDKVNKIFKYKDYLVTRKLEEQTGEFYNQNLIKKINNPKIKSKLDKESSIYGGYSGENQAYYIIYEYKDKKGKEEYRMQGVPIKYAYDIKNGKLSLEEYLKSRCNENQEKFTRILKSKILKNQVFLDENNELQKIISDSEYRNMKQLFLSKEEIADIYNIFNPKKREKLNEEEIQTIAIESYKTIINKMIKEFKGIDDIEKKDILNNGKFEELTIDEKLKTINNLLTCISKACVNLKNIGLLSNAGRKYMINFNKVRLSRMTFIDQSVTGFYERRYRVDELANNNS